MFSPRIEKILLIFSFSFGKCPTLPDDQSTTSPQSKLNHQMKSRLTQTNSIGSYARATIAAALLILGAAMFSVAASNSGGGAKTRPNGSTDNFKKQPALDKTSVIVQLKGDPVSKNSSTKPAQGKKIDFKSTPVKSYRAQLSALRNDFKQWLHTYAPNAKVTS